MARQVWEAKRHGNSPDFFLFHHCHQPLRGIEAHGTRSSRQLNNTIIQTHHHIHGGSFYAQCLWWNDFLGGTRSTLLSEENYARISRASPALPRVVMIDKESQLLHRDGIKQRSFIYLMESYAQEMSLAPFWDASPAIGCKKPFIFDIFRRASTSTKSRAPQIKKLPQSQHHWHKAQLGYTPSCILLVVAVVKWLTLLFRATGPTCGKLVIIHRSHDGSPSVLMSMKNDQKSQLPHEENVKGLLSIHPNDDYECKMFLLLAKEVIEVNRYKNMGGFSKVGQTLTSTKVRGPKREK